MLRDYYGQCIYVYLICTVKVECIKIIQMEHYGFNSLTDLG